jgi:hypothetical protein
MLLGAVVSKVAEISFQTVLVGAFLFGGAFLITLPLNSLWRSRDYRDEEIAEFVLWLWAGGAPADAVEQAGQEGVH